MEESVNVLMLQSLGIVIGGTEPAAFHSCYLIMSSFISAWPSPVHSKFQLKAIADRFILRFSSPRKIVLFYILNNEESRASEFESCFWKLIIEVISHKFIL